MQAQWFPGWPESVALQLQQELRSTHSPKTAIRTIEAATHAAEAVVEGVLGLPPQQAMAHHQWALEALRSWEPDGHQSYRSKLDQTPVPTNGSGGAQPATAAPADLPKMFRNVQESLVKLPDGTVGSGVQLALALEKLLHRVGDSSQLQETLEQCSSEETCAMLKLEATDELLVSSARAAAVSHGCNNHILT